jgi:type II secretory pathway pseudopilin PulG
MEPERKIEKLLRAYAKKRRTDAGAPLELPAAARRRLLQEAARRTPEPAADDSISLWQFFRQQWVLLTGFAVVIFMGATMVFLPTLAASKRKAQRVTAMNQLKQIGLAVQMAAADANGKLPASLAALTNQLGSSQVLTDLESGKPFVYIAGGKNLDSLPPKAMLAYSAEDKDRRAVLLADGTVETVDREAFSELTRSATPQPTVEVALAQHAVNLKTAAPSPIAGEVATLNPATGLPAPAAPPESVTFADNSAGVSGGGGAGASSIVATNTMPLAVNEMAQSLSIPAPNRDRSDTFKPVQGAADSLQPAGQVVNNRKDLFQNTVTTKNTAVLANFQVLPDGNTLRVVDGDGSIYEGSWRLTNAVAQNAPVESAVNNTSPDQNAAQYNLQNNNIQNNPAPAREQMAFQNYSFQVTGTNRTVKQKVVFTGNLMVLLDAVPVSPLAGSQNQTRRLFQANVANNGAAFSWSNARIIGTAVVANTNHIEINAALP